MEGVRSTPQIGGRCESNTSEPQPAQLLLLHGYCLLQPTVNLNWNSSKALPTVKASLGYGITIQTTALRYRIPLTRCQPIFQFTRWSHTFAESVSLLSVQSVIFLSITVNRNLIESPSKGESQPQLRSIYHSYHGAEVYMDFRRTRHEGAKRPQFSCV